MNLSENMVDMLHEIRQIETVEHASIIDVPSDQLGNGLIDLYYESTNLHTRELVTALLEQAGFVWLRKLVSRDTSPVESPHGTIASLDDYMQFLAANDDCDLKAQFH